MEFPLRPRKLHIKSGAWGSPVHELRGVAPRVRVKLYAYTENGEEERLPFPFISTLRPSLIRLHVHEHAPGITNLTFNKLSSFAFTDNDLSQYNHSKFFNYRMSCRNSDHWPSATTVPITCSALLYVCMGKPTCMPTDLNMKNGIYIQNICLNFLL